MNHDLPAHFENCPKFDTMLGYLLWRTGGRNRAMREWAIQRYCPSGSKHLAYVIRSPDEVLYVGVTSRGIVARLREHVTGTTDLSMFLKANPVWKRAYTPGWTVEVYPMFDWRSACVKEQQLIQSLNPRFNRA